MEVESVRETLVPRSRDFSRHCRLVPPTVLYPDPQSQKFPRAIRGPRLFFRRPFVAAGLIAELLWSRVLEASSPEDDRIHISANSTGLPNRELTAWFVEVPIDLDRLRQVDVGQVGHVSLRV